MIYLSPCHFNFSTLESLLKQKKKNKKKQKNKKRREMKYARDMRGAELIGREGDNSSARPGMFHDSFFGLAETGRLIDRHGSRGELPCRSKIKSARVSRLRWLVKHKGNRRRRPESRRCRRRRRRRPRRRRRCRPAIAWESERLLDELENCSHPRSGNGPRL